MPGNTFEGHALIPVTKSFIKKHEVERFTVVADAAMISTDNVEALRAEKINYIVGARLGNVSADLLKAIDAQLSRKDASIIWLKTDNGYLICSFSKKRYHKDKYEMEKQINRDKSMLSQPSKVRKIKYLKSGDSKMASMPGSILIGNEYKEFLNKLPLIVKKANLKLNSLQMVDYTIIVENFIADKLA